jgi:O-antigen/teichoic acid export membrane protein
MTPPRAWVKLRALIGPIDAGSSRGRVALLMTATATSQGIALLVAPFLTRLLGPAAFGVFGVYLASLGVLGAATSWRSGLAVPLPESDEDATALVVAGIAGSFALCAITALVVLVWREPIARVVLHTPEMARLLWLVPVGMLGVGLTDVLSGWCLRYQQFKPLVRIRLERAVGTNVLQLAGGFAVRASAVGLVVGDVAGRLLSVVEMARTIAHAERGRRGHVTRARLRAVISRYRDFALISTPSVFIYAAGQWVPVLLLTFWWGPVAGGLYTIGQRVIGVPIGLLGDSAGQVYASELAKRSRDASATLTQLFRRTARGLFLVGLPAAIGLLFLAPLAFRIAFGAEWHDAGVMLQWQAIALMSQLVAIPLAQTLNVLSLQRRQFAWDASRLVLTVLGFVWAHQAGLSAVSAIAVYGVVTAVTYLFLIDLGWRAVRSRQAEIATRAAAGSA